ncbi:MULTISPECIES: crossover junction endodeoxyribonuclease RuvC [unclassified Bradyrhizobium]|uniref:crossover junction endodeoxyribonuclease RuvC n=1 Tax=unclassified Bradyrhizobium TaxID=2631580 RepID=UPI003393FE96
MPNPYDAIVGLDCSLTDTGMVVIRSGAGDRTPSDWPVVIADSSAEYQPLKDPLRQIMILTQVIGKFELAKRFGRVAVVIEDYAFGKNTGKAFTRAELVGMIKYQALTTFGFDVFLVTPRSVKKLMGSGKFEKNDMALAAKQRYGFVHMNENVVDAFCLARYLVANQEGQLLTLVKHTGLPQYSAVQVPASRGQEFAIKRPLTIFRSKPNLPKLAPRRLRIPTLTTHPTPTR